MFPTLTRYSPSKKDTKDEIKDNLISEYKEYLNKLSIDDLREIAKSDHFQLFKISNVNID